MVMIPFIWQGHKKDFSGLEVSLLANTNDKNELKGINIAGGINKTNSGNMYGLNAGLVNYTKDGIMYGLNSGMINSGNARGLNLGFMNLNDDFEGIRFAIGGNTSDSYSKGIDVSGAINWNSEDSNGLRISGIANLDDDGSKGVYITGGINYSKQVDDWLISYGTLGNIVDEVNPEATVIQFGLWNKAGNSYCPLVNIKGIKNIPKKMSRLLDFLFQD